MCFLNLISALLMLAAGAMSIALPVDGTLVSKGNCITNCKCWGTRTVPQYYCGYCDDVLAAPGQSFSGADSLVICQPGGACCNLGPDDRCKGNLDLEKINTNCGGMNVSSGGLSI